MKRRLSVVYALPDGAQSSVLLRTALVEELTRAGDIEWVFVSPLAANRDFAHAFERPRVELRPWPALRLSFLDRQVQFLRQELWKLRVNNATSRIFARRMPYVEPKRYYLHHQLARACRWLPRIDRVLDGAESWFVPDQAWGDLLDQLAPDAVVLSSGGTKLHEMPLGRAANRRGIPCFGIVPSWDNLTSKGPLSARCRRLAVWCELMRQEAVELCGYQSGDVVITGPPAFDPHAERPAPRRREAFCADLGLDPKRKLITYTSVPPSTCKWSAGYAELLARLIQTDQLGGPCQLLVRMHPQDEFAAYERLAALPHVHLERPGLYRSAAKGNQAILCYDPTARDVRHLTETLAFSDVVVNIASTITLEACALDRPVVNIAFNLPEAAGQFDIRDYYQLTHYRPVTDSGAVNVAPSEEALVRAIREALERPDERSWQRQALYRLYDPFGDGQAAARLAEAILTFVYQAAGVSPVPPSRITQEPLRDRSEAVASEK